MDIDLEDLIGASIQHVYYRGGEVRNKIILDYKLKGRVLLLFLDDDTVERVTYVNGSMYTNDEFIIKTKNSKILTRERLLNKDKYVISKWS